TPAKRAKPRITRKKGKGSSRRRRKSPSGLVDAWRIPKTLPRYGKADYIVGIGCSLRKDGTASSHSQAVAEECVRLYEEGDKTQKIVFSGGYSQNGISEAEAMRKAALIICPEGADDFLTDRAPEEKYGTEKQITSILEAIQRDRGTKELSGIKVIGVAQYLHARRAVALLREGLKTHGVDVYQSPALKSEYDKAPTQPQFRFGEAGFLVWEILNCIRAILKRDIAPGSLIARRHPDKEKIKAIEKWLMRFPELRKIIEDKKVAFFPDPGLVQDNFDPTDRREIPWPGAGVTRLIYDLSTPRKVIGYKWSRIGLNPRFASGGLREVATHEVLEIDVLTELSRLQLEKSAYQYIKSGRFTDFMAAARQMARAGEFGYKIDGYPWHLAALEVLNYFGVIERTFVEEEDFLLIEIITDLLGSSGLGEEFTRYTDRYIEWRRSSKTPLEDRLEEVTAKRPRKGMAYQPVPPGEDRVGTGFPPEGKRALIELAEEVLGIHRDAGLETARSKAHRAKGIEKKNTRRRSPAGGDAAKDTKPRKEWARIAAEHLYGMFRENPAMDMLPSQKTAVEGIPGLSAERFSLYLPLILPALRDIADRETEDARLQHRVNEAIRKENERRARRKARVQQTATFNMEETVQHIIYLFRNDPARITIARGTELAKKFPVLPEFFNKKLPDIADALEAEILRSEYDGEADLRARVLKAINIYRDIVGAATDYLFELFQEETGRFAFPLQKELGSAFGIAQTAIGKYYPEISRRILGLIDEMPPERSSQDYIQRLRIAATVLENRAAGVVEYIVYAFENDEEREEIMTPAELVMLITAKNVKTATLYYSDDFSENISLLEERIASDIVDPGTEHRIRSALERYRAQKAEVDRQIAERVRHRFFNLNETVEYIIVRFYNNRELKRLPNTLELAAALGPSHDVFGVHYKEITPELRSRIGQEAFVEKYDTPTRDRLRLAIDLYEDFDRAVASYIIGLFRDDASRTQLPAFPELARALDRSENIFINHFPAIIENLLTLSDMIDEAGLDAKVRERIRRAVNKIRMQIAASRFKTIPRDVREMSAAKAIIASDEELADRWDEEFDRRSHQIASILELSLQRQFSRGAGIRRGNITIIAHEAATDPVKAQTLTNVLRAMNYEPARILQAMRRLDLRRGDEEETVEAIANRFVLSEAQALDILDVWQARERHSTEDAVIASLYFLGYRAYFNFLLHLAGADRQQRDMVLELVESSRRDHEQLVSQVLLNKFPRSRGLILCAAEGALTRPVARTGAITLSHPTHLSIDAAGALRQSEEAGKIYALEVPFENVSGISFDGTKWDSFVAARGEYRILGVNNCIDLRTDRTSELTGLDGETISLLLTEGRVAPSGRRIDNIFVSRPGHNLVYGNREWPQAVASLQNEAMEWDDELIRAQISEQVDRKPTISTGRLDHLVFFHVDDKQIMKARFVHGRDGHRLIVPTGRSAWEDPALPKPRDETRRRRKSPAGGPSAGRRIDVNEWLREKTGPGFEDWLRDLLALKEEIGRLSSGRLDRNRSFAYIFNGAVKALVIFSEELKDISPADVDYRDALRDIHVGFLMALKDAEAYDEIYRLLTARGRAVIGRFYLLLGRAAARGFRAGSAMDFFATAVNYLSQAAHEGDEAATQDLYIALEALLVVDFLVTKLSLGGPVEIATTSEGIHRFARGMREIESSAGRPWEVNSYFLNEKTNALYQGRRIEPPVSDAENAIQRTGTHAETGTFVTHDDELRGDWSSFTPFVTLEPCLHCAQAMIIRGIRRVFFFTVDPNPIISGEGLRHLLWAGVYAVFPSEYLQSSTHALIADDARIYKMSEFDELKESVIPALTLSPDELLEEARGHLTARADYTYRDQWRFHEVVSELIHHRDAPEEEFIPPQITVINANQVREDKADIDEYNPVAQAARGKAGCVAGRSFWVVVAGDADNREDVIRKLQALEREGRRIFADTEIAVLDGLEGENLEGLKLTDLTGDAVRPCSAAARAYSPRKPPAAGTETKDKPEGREVRRRRRRSPSGLKLLTEKVPVVHSFHSPTDHYTPEILTRLLRHSAKDAERVNDFAIEFSRRTKKPVLLVGMARTGTPYTWAVDNWWSQLKDERAKEKFDKEVDALLESWGKTKKDRKEAEFIIAQRWMDKGRISWYVHVTQEFIPSYNSGWDSGKGLSRVWKSAIENTSVNLLFVDDSTRREHDNLDKDYSSVHRIDCPSSFHVANNFALPKISRKGADPSKFFLDTGDIPDVDFEKDAFSIVFLRAGTRIPKPLIGTFPIHDRNLPPVPVKKVANAWWDNIDQVFGDSINHSASEIYEPAVTVETSIGEMRLNEFVELKLKEYSGWFERNRADLISYAVSEYYIAEDPRPEAPDRERTSVSRRPTRRRRSPSGYPNGALRDSERKPREEIMARLESLGAQDLIDAIESAPERHSYILDDPFLNDVGDGFWNNAERVKEVLHSGKSLDEIVGCENRSRRYFENLDRSIPHIADVTASLLLEDGEEKFKDCKFLCLGRAADLIYWTMKYFLGDIARENCRIIDFSHTWPDSLPDMYEHPEALMNYLKSIDIHPDDKILIVDEFSSRKLPYEVAAFIKLDPMAYKDIDGIDLSKGYAHKVKGRGWKKNEYLAGSIYGSETGTNRFAPWAMEYLTNGYASGRSYEVKIVNGEWIYEYTDSDVQGFAPPVYRNGDCWGWLNRERLYRFLLENEAEYAERFDKIRALRGPTRIEARRKLETAKARRRKSPSGSKKRRQRVQKRSGSTKDVQAGRPQPAPKTKAITRRLMLLGLIGISIAVPAIGVVVFTLWKLLSDSPPEEIAVEEDPEELEERLSPEAQKAEKLIEILKEHMGYHYNGGLTYYFNNSTGPEDNRWEMHGKQVLSRMFEEIFGLEVPELKEMAEEIFERHDREGNAGPARFDADDGFEALAVFLRRHGIYLEWASWGRFRAGSLEVPDVKGLVLAEIESEAEGREEVMGEDVAFTELVLGKEIVPHLLRVASGDMFARPSASDGETNLIVHYRERHERQAQATWEAYRDKKEAYSRVDEFLGSDEPEAQMNFNRAMAQRMAIADWQREFPLSRWEFAKAYTMHTIPASRLHELVHLRFVDTPFFHSELYPEVYKGAHRTDKVRTSLSRMFLWRMFSDGKYREAADKFFAHSVRYICDHPDRFKKIDAGAAKKGDDYLLKQFDQLSPEEARLLFESHLEILVRETKGAEGSKPEPDESAYSPITIPISMTLAEGGISRPRVATLPAPRPGRIMRSSPSGVNLPAVEVIDEDRVSQARLEGGAFFFDFDFTLWTGFPLDAQARITASWLKGAEATLEETAEVAAFYERVTGRQLKPMIQMLLDERGIEAPSDIDDLIADITAGRERAIEEDNRLSAKKYLVPWTKRFLYSLHRKKLHLAVVTGGSPARRKGYAERLDIEKYFPAFHGGGKKEEFISAQLLEWGLAPNQAAMVGDGILDIEAALASGVLAIGLARSPEHRERLIEAGAHIVINRDYKGYGKLLETLDLSAKRKHGKASPRRASPSGARAPTGAGQVMERLETLSATRLIRAIREEPDNYSFILDDPFLNDDVFWNDAERVNEVLNSDKTHEEIFGLKRNPYMYFRLLDKHIPHIMDVTAALLAEGKYAGRKFVCLGRAADLIYWSMRHLLGEGADELCYLLDFSHGIPDCPAVYEENPEAFGRYLRKRGLLPEYRILIVDEMSAQRFPDTVAQIFKDRGHTDVLAIDLAHDFAKSVRGRGWETYSHIGALRYGEEGSNFPAFEAMSFLGDEFHSGRFFMPSVASGEWEYNYEDNDCLGDEPRIEKNGTYWGWLNRERLYKFLLEEELELTDARTQARALHCRRSPSGADIDDLMGHSKNLDNYDYYLLDWSDIPTVEQLEEFVEGIEEYFEPHGFECRLQRSGDRKWYFAARGYQGGHSRKNVAPEDDPFAKWRVPPEQVDNSLPRIVIHNHDENDNSASAEEIGAYKKWASQRKRVFKLKAKEIARKMRYYIFTPRHGFTPYDYTGDYADISPEELLTQIERLDERFPPSSAAGKRRSPAGSREDAVTLLTPMLVKGDADAIRSVVLDLPADIAKAIADASINLYSYRSAIAMYKMLGGEFPQQQIELIRKLRGINVDIAPTGINFRKAASYIVNALVLTSADPLRLYRTFFDIISAEMATAEQSASRKIPLPITLRKDMRKDDILFRGSFAGIEDLTDAVAQDFEIGLRYYPEPDDWPGSYFREYSVISALYDPNANKITDMGRYATWLYLRLYDHIERRAGAADTSALRAEFMELLEKIGIIGGNGMLAIMKGDFRSVDVEMLPLGNEGHSHPRFSIYANMEHAEPSNGDFEIARRTHKFLTALPWSHPARSKGVSVLRRRSPSGNVRFGDYSLNKDLMTADAYSKLTDAHKQDLNDQADKRMKGPIGYMDNERKEHPLYHKSTTMYILTEGAKELLSAVEPEDRIVALGRSPALLVWAASVIEGRDPEEEWFTGASERYVHAAVSGIMKPDDILKHKALYRRYMEKIGLTPQRILTDAEQGKKTVIVEGVLEEITLPAFLNFMIDWAQELCRDGALEPIKSDRALKQALTYAIRTVDIRCAYDEPDRNKIEGRKG
ncbi:HAD family hydrolase, partial [Candidatus Omnitrophota bacterium]